VPNEPRLILFPGLGADGRMYEPQRAAFPHLEVPRWLEPRRRETLADFARRTAEHVARDDGRPLYLGGSSFGGMVALEAARHLRPRAVFLIGSCRSPRSVPWPFRLAGRAGRLAPGPVLRAIHAVNSRSTRMFGDLDAAQHAAMVAMMRDADPRFVQWGGHALACWAGAAGEPLPCPVHHIHGDADRIMPCRLVRPDVIVPGAGHLLSVTHADAVNAFLRERIAHAPAADQCRRRESNGGREHTLQDSN
jgi:pimeloyl-ACP methyl ester carboxylesterase